MKKLLAGSLALGLAGVSALGWTGISSAQEVPGLEELSANLSPTTVQAGGTVTVTSVDPCDEDALFWGFGASGWAESEEGVALGEGEATLGDDGSWTVSFQAPTTAGAYDFIAACVTPADFEPGEAPEEVIEGEMDEAATLGGDHDEHGSSSSSSSSSTEPTMPPDDEPTIGLYGPLTFTVQGAASARPATPVRGTPQFTG